MKPISAQVVLESRLFSARRQGVLLSRVSKRQEESLNGSWFFGGPSLPPSISWPVLVGENPPHMEFIAQINLSFVPRLYEFPHLPRSGTLFFFTIIVNNGFKNETKIIYLDEDVSCYPIRQHPQAHNSNRTNLAQEKVKFTSFSAFNDRKGGLDSLKAGLLFPLHGKENLKYMFGETGWQPSCVNDCLSLLTVDAKNYYEVSTIRFCVPLIDFKNMNFDNATTAVEY